MRTLTPFKIGLGIAGMLVVALIGLYLTSDTLTDTRKADKLADASSASHTESLISETQADAVAAQVEAKEAERVEALRELSISRETTLRQKEELQTLRSKYDAIRKNKPVISDDNLTDRERKLLTELRELYP